MRNEYKRVKRKKGERNEGQTWKKRKEMEKEVTKKKKRKRKGKGKIEDVNPGKDLWCHFPGLIVTVVRSQGSTLAVSSLGRQ